MRLALVVFLGMSIAAATSAYLSQQAWREGQKTLAWTMGVVAGVFCALALYFGSQA